MWRLSRPFLWVILAYVTVGRLAAAFGPPPRDALVVDFERAVTRGALPPLTAVDVPRWAADLLSIAYVAYFALPALLVGELSRRRDREAVRVVTLTLAAAFYIHYALYVCVPVLGPMRTNAVPAAARDRFLAQGGAVTHVVRRTIGALEGTAPDAFPSAHTSIALLAAAFARKYRLRTRRAIYALTTMIVVAIIVLGYHYLTDIAAAAPIAGLVWAGVPLALDRRVAQNQQSAAWNSFIGFLSG